MPKKLLAIFLVFALLFSLTACSTSKNGDDTPADTAKDNGVSGLWQVDKKTKVNHIMNDTEGVEIPNESTIWLDVFSQIDSDVELDAYIEFKDDNSYVLKYKLDDFKAALKEYYKEVFELFKVERDLFEVTYNMDVVVIETMMRNSSLTSFEQIVDSFEEKTVMSIDGMSDALTIASLVPAIQDGEIKDGYVVVKGYKYELDGKNLKIHLDEKGEVSAEMSLNGDKIEFTSASENINADIFKNGLNKVK